MATITIAHNPSLTSEQLKGIFESKFGRKYEICTPLGIGTGFVIKQSDWTGVGIWLKQDRDRTVLKYHGLVPTGIARIILLLFTGPFGFLFLAAVTWKPLRAEIVEFVETSPELMGESARPELAAAGLSPRPRTDLAWLGFVALLAVPALAILIILKIGDHSRLFEDVPYPPEAKKTTSVPPPSYSARVSSAVESADGKAFRIEFENGPRLDCVRIPPGRIVMHNDSSGNESDNVKAGTYEIVIAKAFYMGIYEVTQEQYKAVMETNPSRFKGMKHPVEGVSVSDITVFCDRLSRQIGRTVRLPTEAEWEYACRAGTSTLFNTGESLDVSKANCGGSYINGTTRHGGGRDMTVPVGTFMPNDYGLYDMHGNVAEYCSDGKATHATEGGRSGRKGERKTITEPPIVRGGSWNDRAMDCRSSYRGFPYRVESCGFRVVIPLTE
ncbi:MAG: Serine/threonine-protein kinase pkn1 [Planctomycetes bacterium ADurb.Bin126]|nr:MAG: Serine/threonine-protein kinase pkn1 [Planctomycetes bacterium ADurb.Bin126]